MIVPLLSTLLLSATPTVRTATLTRPAAPQRFPAIAAHALSGGPGARPATSSLAAEIDVFLRVLSVPGRERRAAQFVRARLGALPARTDADGDVILSLGSGAPRRLIACPLDEPGYVVGAITPDGYLRLRPVGALPRGALWNQFHEGQKLVIETAAGPITGALGVRSIHLNGRGERPPFGLRDAYVDVGPRALRMSRLWASGCWTRLA